MKLHHLHIRNARLALRISQKDLAYQANIDQKQLRKWERGFGVPGIQEANRLAAVLGIDSRQLIEAQAEYSQKAIPGEGYTTALNSNNDQIIYRKLDPPPDAKRVLDLFCGAGGLSFGFELTDEFISTCGIDLLPDRISSFVANHNFANGVVSDLRSFSISKLEKLTGPVNVIVGGPPCQGFSSVRPFRKLSEGDPRNSLVEQYLLIIKKLQPDWFVFENVVGILTHQKGIRLKNALRSIQEAGYSADWRVINAALFGVPQNRERVVIVGNKLGIPFVWPQPTHHIIFKSMAGSRPEVIKSEYSLFNNAIPNAITLEEAIDDLPSLSSGSKATEYNSAPNNNYQKIMREKTTRLTLHEATKHSPKMIEIIKHAGKNISALPDGMVTSGFSSCYSRLDPDKPSTTLTVNFVHPASNRCIHPYQDRALTPREGARIQSFPDHFIFCGTRAQIVKQIGNAVPPFLGQKIAEAIIISEKLHKRRAS